MSECKNHWLKCFRLPFLAALLLAALLVTILQPRPDHIYRFQGNFQPESRPEEDVQVSPSGQFLAACIRSNGAIELYDMASGSRLFHLDHGTVNQFRFDSENRLIFESKRPGGSLDSTTWCWTPQSSQPVKTKSIPSLPDSIHLSSIITMNQLCDMALSPDARTWVVPIADKDTVSFEILDTGTGKRRCLLDLQFNEHEAKQITRRSFHHARNGEFIAIQYCCKDYSNEATMQLFSTSIGKATTKPFHLPHFIDIVLDLNADEILGYSAIKEGIYLQRHSPSQGYQQTPIPSTVEQRSQVIQNLDISFQPHYLEQHTYTKGILTFAWRHGDKSLYAGGCFPPGVLSGIHLGQINTSTGLDQIHLERGRMEFCIAPEEQWNVHALFSNQALVQLPQQQLTGWKYDFEEWRYTKASWLAPIFYTPVQLELIDLPTGKGQRLNFNCNRVHAFHHQATNSLFVANSEPGELILRQYSLPLHAPWQLICLWSVLTFLLLSAWQYYRHANRRAVSSTKQMAPA